MSVPVARFDREADMIDVFMILLTADEHGGTSGAFATQFDHAVCEARLPAIIHTVEQSGHRVTQALCVEGDWPFTAFSHQRTEGAERQYFSVDLSFSPPVIRPAIDPSTCATEHDPVANRYCVHSSQSWTE
jgi:hypothetical protein